MITTGIFGGSFNPIHNGHVELARQLLASAGLDEIWFVVSPQNPFKRAADLLDDDLRLKMVELALEREPRMHASDYEFRMPRPSYMWHTLQSMSRDYPDRPVRPAHRRRQLGALQRVVCLARHPQSLSHSYISPRRFCRRRSVAARRSQSRRHPSDRHQQHAGKAVHCRRPSDKRSCARQRGPLYQR